MSRKYRVLHVINSLSRAGTERQLILNLAALDRTRFESFLCYLYPIHYLADDVRSLGIHVFCLGLKGKGQWFSGLYHLVKFIKTMNIDIVHTNLFESDILGGIAAKLSGVPAISTLASPADSSVKFLNELHLNAYKLGLARFIHQEVYRVCHRRLIAVSEYVKDSWSNSSKTFKARITVIPRAISQSLVQLEPSSAATNARTKLSLDNAYPVLLNVGRLIPHKGQKYILEAMPLILERFPEARLLIAGEGPLKDDLENTRKDLGLDKAVALLGSYSDVRSLHLASDIFVFPSLSEGMPGALLEAAALGKPCVAADIDPVKEILKDGESGLLIPQRNSQALAQAVIRLSSNKEEAQAFGCKARETVLSKHLIDELIKKLETLYTQTIGD